jgi:REP element-mobilizing transposase RayT
VEKYLSTQGEHHGYDKRALPPVFLERYDLTTTDLSRLAPAHAAVIAQFHCVLATTRRRGVLGSVEGKKVSAEWKKVDVGARFAIIKVSFVPDHLHVALRAHPAVSPVAIVLGLMKSAQEVLSKEMIAAGLDRLWQTSVYVGSYGNLASVQVRKYIENWERGE